MGVKTCSDFWKQALYFRFLCRICYQELNYSSALTRLSLLPKSLIVTCLELHSRTFNPEHSLVNPAQMWLFIIFRGEKSML